MWLISLTDRKQAWEGEANASKKSEVGQKGRREGNEGTKERATVEGSKVGGTEERWKIWTPSDDAPIRFCLDKGKLAAAACHAMPLRRQS